MREAQSQEGEWANLGGDLSAKAKGPSPSFAESYTHLFFYTCMCCHTRIALSLMATLFALIAMVCATWPC